MKVTFEMIQSATNGCASLSESSDGIHFHRFTSEQSKFYQETNSDFYWKSHATSGVILEFTTDSRSLTISLICKLASSRKSTYHDIFSNGKLVAHLGGDVNGASVSFGGTYALEDGIKKIRIYFPWSSNSILQSMELDDGALFVPARRPNKMLIFGDSITHGYDAFYPSQTYASLLADGLNADARNKGIGGELFAPGLLDTKEDIDPKIITVAYGTNDWSSVSLEKVRSGIASFYTRLSELYPNAEIFGISPIWRTTANLEKPSGKLENIHPMIVELTKELPNIHIINGYYLVPHDSTLFSDGVHPTPTGHAHYAHNLIREILKQL